MQEITIKEGNFLINSEWKRNNPEEYKYSPATPKAIEDVEQAVHRDDVYKTNGLELEYFFCINNNQANNDRDTVIHKILLIDYTNSTNLRMYGKKGTSVFSLADRIIENGTQLDQMIQEGNPRAIKLIAGFETVNLFSFATKYCCYHNTICYKRDDYSIYDRIVARTIPYYLKVNPSFISNCRKNQDYLEYKKIIDTLIAVYDLQSIPKIRRKIDHFLWFQDKAKKQINRFAGGGCAASVGSLSRDTLLNAKRE